MILVRSFILYVIFSVMILYSDDKATLDSHTSMLSSSTLYGLIGLFAALFASLVMMLITWWNKEEEPYLFFFVETGSVIVIQLFVYVSGVTYFSDL